MMRKGVNEIIATLLLIAIAFSVGSFLYIFYSTQIQIQRAEYQLSIDRYTKLINTDFGVTWYSYNSTSNILTLYIYNYGDREVRIVRIYIDSNPFDIALYLHPDGLSKLNLSIALQSGEHNIVIVDEEGYRYATKIRI